MRRAIAVIVTCLAVLVVSAVPASAKAPPRGKYDCTIGGSTLFGTLSIKTSGRYGHRGTKGRYIAKGGAVTFPDGIVGYRIRFKRGTLDGVRGRWYKAKDGTPEGTYEIALRNPRDDFESIYCSRRK